MKLLMKKASGANRLYYFHAFLVYHNKPFFTIAFLNLSRKNLLVKRYAAIKMFFVNLQGYICIALFAPQNRAKIK